MQTLVLALLLFSILTLLLEGVQNRIRAVLHRNGALVWSVPFLLTAIFVLASFLAGVPGA